jgi:hypothetical protein
MSLRFAKAIVRKLEGTVFPQFHGTFRHVLCGNLPGFHKCGFVGD